VIEEKLAELKKYLRGIAFRSQVFENQRDDVVHSTLVRLVEEDSAKPFFTPKELFGRATNVMREEIAKSFAASLPLSGVGFQAHYYARKYLSQNNQDPHAAYANQNETTKVGLDLLKLVAGGTGQTDPEDLERLELADTGVVSSLSHEKEDRVREAVRGLPDEARAVVEKYLGFNGGPMPLTQVADDLGLTTVKTKALWSEAKSLLRETLD